MKTKDALILGICIIIAFAIFGAFFYQARAQTDTITVVGSASKEFTSDLVKWHIQISRELYIENPIETYRQIKEDANALLEILKANGISEKDISLQPIVKEPIYDPMGGTRRYQLILRGFVVSSDISKVEALALNPDALFEKGIFLDDSRLEYFYTKLSELKHELLAQATQDARRRAEEIAKGSGATINKIVSARAGVFQITEPYSTEVSDYGVYSTATKEKNITVTVRATFLLK
ncbi:MAG: SIMPL domain-containing protein [Candidatus Bathyarchaeia archaeon]